MKKIFKKLKENKKLKNRVIACVSTTLAFVLFLSSFFVFRNHKQNIKAAENKNQNAIEENLKNEQPNESAESKNSSDAHEENFETESNSELSSESAQNAEKEEPSQNVEKTPAPSVQKSEVPTTKKATSSTGSSSSGSSSGSSSSGGSYSWDDSGSQMTTVPTCTTHTWGAWVIEDGQNHYRTCKKCGSEEVNKNWEWKPEYHMGTKAEYLELLGYINKVRREAGLNELVYLDEFQDGANIRAQELTESFSHTRPNGGKFYTAYVNDDKVFSLMNENAAGVATITLTAKQAFNSWMNSEGHKKNILNANGEYFVCARCGGCWVMSLAFKI